MNTNRRCASGRRLLSIAATLVAFLLSSLPLQAQTSSIPDRLPSDTILYLHWHGKTLASGAQEKNHLLQLLTDPDFAPLRDALAKASQSSAEKEGKAPPLEFTEISSLLENPGTFGIVVLPPPPKADSESNATPRVGAFVVYDATGKIPLMEKLKAAHKPAGKVAPEVTTYDFHGTAVEVRTTATDTSYSARAANYYLYSDQKQLIEDLIGRFSAKATPANSVTQLPEYKSIQPFMSSDSTMDFFAQMPDWRKVAPPAKLDTPVFRFAQNLHWEKVHAMGGSISFAGEATRFHGAILGDTSAPGLFDIAGASGVTFRTLPAVKPGPFFSANRYDLTALYQLMRSAALGSLPPDKAAGIAGAEGMAQAYLGMPIGDALQLFTGEFASQGGYSDDGSSLKMYAISIQKPQEMLRLLRAVIGKLIVAEDTAGDTTFLDISIPQQDPVTGQQKRSFYYVAVTPQVIYVAPRKAMVREAMARLSARAGEAPSTGPLPSAELNRMRGLLPEKLSGLSVADMTNLPWDKIFLRITEQINEAARGAKEPPPQFSDWLKLMKPEVFSRHLHAAISGWWKDSNGVYFDAYLQ